MRNTGMALTLEHEEAARVSFADHEDYGYNSEQRVLKMYTVPSVFPIDV
jgi:hypothetical protein